MTPKTNYVHFWRHQDIFNYNKKVQIISNNIVLIDLKIQEIIKNENVGKDGNRQIPKICLMCFENLEYGINIFQKDEI